MLNLVVWMTCGWFIGVAVAAALGWVSRNRLAWYGLLGALAAVFGGSLLAPLFHMPAQEGFSLAAAAVAVVCSILMCVLGNVAAWGARRIERKESWEQELTG